MWRVVWILASLGISRGWTLPDRPIRAATPVSLSPVKRHAARSDEIVAATAPETNNNNENDMFEGFVDFLRQKQSEIIAELEEYEEGSATFSRDAWGIFEEEKDGTTATTGSSGGITRVLQGGSNIEKGACSLTVIRQGVLSADRAATIRSRQDNNISIQQGDKYAAAALSMVLHSRSPHVPTFRSDVRVFCVNTASGDDGGPQTLAWFGGGAGKILQRLATVETQKFPSHPFIAQI